MPRNLLSFFTQNMTVRDFKEKYNKTKRLVAKAVEELGNKD